tara:strand:+ start:5459 stop:6001 length:543 start_codon:yes stop_codon:yes gene_type:complete
MTSETNNFNYLMVYVEGDNELKELYRTKIDEHNNKIADNIYPDAGFDLFCPVKSPVYYGSPGKIDLKIKCAMYKNSSWINNGFNIEKTYLSYYMYPRSSISKTNLRLANSVGIIDSGYRGNLCAVVDNINDHEVAIVDKHQRLFQICSPTLSPLVVKLIDNIDFFETTIRGSGGFGSTGH